MKTRMIIKTPQCMGIKSSKIYNKIIKKVVNQNKIIDESTLRDLDCERKQQKQYAKDFLLEIHNQSSNLYLGETKVEGENICEKPHTFDLEVVEQELIELGSYDGFSALYKHGLEYRIYFTREGGNDDDGYCDGYFSLHILFYENETKLICEIVKDTENVRASDGIYYEPVSELIYEKTINWQDLNDYDFQCQEYKFFKQAISNKQF
jgi:hypothetical protein